MTIRSAPGARLHATDQTAGALRAFLHTDLAGVIRRDDPVTRPRTLPPPKRPRPGASF